MFLKKYSPILAFVGTTSVKSSYSGDAEEHKLPLICPENMNLKRT